MSDFDPIKAARNVGRAALGPLGEFAPGMGGKADPLKLFERDTMTGGGKASGKAGAPALPGNGDGINDLLAKLGGLDDKHRIAGAESAANVSTGMGKDGGNASAAGADGGGAGGAGGGAQAIIGQIMNIVKQLLPMIMGMLGGL